MLEGSDDGGLDHVWRYYLDNKEEIYSWCLLAANWNHSDAEDLVIDEVIRMLPERFARFDPSRGVDFHAYVRRYFQWHLPKVMSRKRKLDTIDRENFPELVADAANNDIETQDTLSNWFSLLNSTEAIIVRRHVLKGHTLDAIAESMAMEYRTVRLTYQKAMARLRAYESQG